MTKQQKKQEAIARMKMLKLHSNPIREFMEEDIINLSEHGGMLYWLNNKQTEYVKNFEEKYNSVVYHVIHSYTEFGELLAFLYVSDDEDEWEYDRANLKDGYACAYVENLDDGFCSEFGSIGIKSQLGGLVRTA